MLGVLAAWLAYFSERGPELWYLGLVFFIFVVFHVLAVMLAVTRQVRAVMPMWTITGATLVAAVAMATFLLLVHPRLRRVLGSGEDGDETEEVVRRAERATLGTHDAGKP
jgi:membrane protein YdbS with pleckstrin-like domain